MATTLNKNKSKKKKQARTKPSDVVIPVLSIEQVKAAEILAQMLYSKNGGRSNGAVTHAARVAGVSRGAVHYWIKNEENFYAEVERLKEVAYHECVQALHEQSVKGDTRAIIAELIARDPDMWDAQLRRDRERRAHEERLATLHRESIQHAIQQLPAIHFIEATNGHMPTIGVVQ